MHAQMFKNTKCEMHRIQWKFIEVGRQHILSYCLLVSVDFSAEFIAFCFGLKTCMYIYIYIYYIFGFRFSYCVNYTPLGENRSR